MDQRFKLWGGGAAHRSRRVFSRVGWAMVALMVLQVAGQYLLQLLVVRLAPALLEWEGIFYLLAAAANYLFAFPAALLILRTLPTQPRGEKRPLTGRQGLSLWLMALGCLYLSNMLTLALMGAFAEGYGAPIPNPLDAVAEQGVVYNLVVSCLLAPIAEELCFRRSILNRLRPWGEGFAVCTSALLFALVHGNPYQMLYAFTVGIILGCLYLYTGQVRWTMLLHGGLNLVSAALLPLAGLAPGGEWALSLLIMVAMAWAVQWFLRRRGTIVQAARAAGWGNGEVWSYFLVNPGVTVFTLAVVWLVWWTMFA